MTREDFEVGAESSSLAAHRGARLAGWVRDNVYSLDTLLRVLLSWTLPCRDGLLLHAGGVRLGRGGVAVVGPSGAGKSTFCRRAGARRVIGDEVIALAAPRGRKGGWRLHGSPFWGDMARGRGPAWIARGAAVVPLVGLAYLSRDRRRATGPHRLLRCILNFCDDPAHIERILRLVARLERDIPQTEFAFHLAEPWPTLESRLHSALGTRAARARGQA